MFHIRLVHVTNNETAKITAAPYKAGKVNHAMNNETAKKTSQLIHIRLVWSTM